MTTDFWSLGPGGQAGPVSEAEFRAFLPTVTHFALISNTPYEPGTQGGTVTATFDLDNFQVTNTPEPGTWTLMLFGAMAVAAKLQRRTI